MHKLHQQYISRQNSAIHIIVLHGMAPHLEWVHIYNFSTWQKCLHNWTPHVESISVVGFISPPTSVFIFKSATKAFRSFHYRINRCSTPPMHGRFLYTRPPNYTPIPRSSRLDGLCKGPVWTRPWWWNHPDQCQTIWRQCWPQSPSHLFQTPSWVWEHNQTKLTIQQCSGRRPGVAQELAYPAKAKQQLAISISYY